MSIKKVPILESFTWQLPTKDKDLSSPPGSPAKGDRYIIAATGSGDWTSHTGDIALCTVGGGTPSWEFVTKVEGMICWVEDENLFYRYNGSNWNILDFVKNDGTVNPTNLLSNGDFENWSAGTSVAPDGWTLNSSISAAIESSIIKLGTSSVKLTNAAGIEGGLYQSIHTNRGINYWKGLTVTYGCWVYATQANKARLRIYDGIGLSNSSFHTGNSTWQWLTVTRTIDNSATSVMGICSVDYVGNYIAYFDGAILVEGSSSFAFSDKPAEEGVWADYSTISTIVGWSSFTTKLIHTKKIGKIVFVSFILAGTSNATNITFTVPYTSSYLNSFPYYQFPLSFLYNNSTASVNPGLISLPGNSTTVTVMRDMTAATWTASLIKEVRGHFWYIIP